MRHVRRVVTAAYFIFLASSFIGALIKPCGFQKSAAIREKDPREWDGVEHGEIDIAGFVGNIPFRQSSGKFVYEVDPERKFNATIGRGEGDCSNMVYGTAWYLSQRKVDYGVVYILPREKFLDGTGHTVLRVRYLVDGKVRRGIVDILGGGIPLSRNRYLTMADLQTGGLPYTQIRQWNKQATTDAQYYGRFLDESEIGYVPGRQINRYFQFIRAIYIPLGSAKLEKYFYDGLAILAGIYPNVYVNSVADIYGSRLWMRYFFLASVWIMRSAVIAVPGMIILILLRKRHARTVKPRVISEYRRAPAFHPRPSMPLPTFHSPSENGMHDKLMDEEEREPDSAA